MADVRSRRGCIICRRRRRKCDEVRPQCIACQKRGTSCEYPFQLRWTVADIPATYKPRRKGQKNGFLHRKSKDTTAIYEKEPEPCDNSVIQDLTQELQQDQDENESEVWVLDDEISPLEFESVGEGIAFAYWFKYLSGVIPAYDSIHNPYRRLSKLALASPVLFNTIISLATEYMYCHGHMGAELTIMRQNRALSSLREALVAPAVESPSSDIASTDMSDSELSPKQATLAAVLLQIANVVFVGGSGVDVHLACAMHFLQDLEYLNRPVEDFVPRLLIQRFAVVDVLTSIVRRRRPNLPITCWIFTPNDSLDQTEPSFREMTGCPQPILGFLARICHLVVDISENTRQKLVVFDEAFGLETDLRVYARSGKFDSSNQMLATKHLDTLSQCFYWSAHLILQRGVYKDPASAPRVQKTVSTLVDLIKSMPVGCGPDSSLPLPFFLSSKEAIDENHRSWVRQRNQEMKQVYPGRTRDALMSLLEEIWGCIDAGCRADDDSTIDVEEAIIDAEIKRDLFIF